MKRIVLAIFDSFAYWLAEDYIEKHPDSFLAYMKANGLYFTNFYATSTCSHPSYPSIFLGVYPRKHRVFQMNGKSSRVKNYSNDDTLNHVLSINGYTVQAYSDESWMFMGRYGYSFKVISGANNFNVEKKYKSNNVFVLLNYWGTHTPYGLDKNVANEFTCHDIKVAMNEGNKEKEVKARECVISKIHKAFDRYDKILSKLDDGKTTIVLTADHGEDLYLHGENGVPAHGGLPYDSVAKVPFMIYPYKEPEIVNDLYSGSDTKNIILDLAFEDRFNPIEREYEEITGCKHEATGKEFSAGFVFKDGIKYFVEYNPVEPKRYCYDLIKDPEETNNILWAKYIDISRIDADIYKKYDNMVKKNYPMLYDKDLYNMMMSKDSKKIDNDDKVIKERLKSLGYM